MIRSKERFLTTHAGSLPRPDDLVRMMYAKEEGVPVEPEALAARYANLAERENVIAGSDCGCGTWVGQAAVDPDVVWAKFKAMADGARLASRQFWK